MRRFVGSFVGAALVLGLAATLSAPGLVPDAYAEETPSGKALLEQIDKNMTFESRTMTVAMSVAKNGRTKTYKMVAHARGEDEAAIEYLEPARDKGTKMLRHGDELLMYVPALEKVQKISGHMLRDGMMGSDVSYEDMMAAGRLAEDYDATVLGSEDCGNGRSCWKVEMKAKNNTISYPKRVAWIDQEHKIMAKQELYALSGQLLKKWSMTDVQPFPNGRMFPLHMEIEDQLQQGSKTVLVLSDVKFGVALEAEVFSSRWLERGS